MINNMSLQGEYNTTAE